MKNNSTLSLLVLIIFTASCSVSRTYSPVQKFSPQQLKEDFTIARNILESKHPSLYWYTGKDSMDTYFDVYYNAIRDSMTEQQFAWHILSPVIDKIHCGHTTVSMSKAFSKWSRGKRLPSFPLFVKVWGDTMAVTGNLNRKDSIFKRGTLITAINGVKNAMMIKRIFSFLPEDGHANNINYIRLSGNLPYFHRNIYGLSKEYKVDYIDATGKPATATVPLFSVSPDSTKRDSLRRDSIERERPKISRKQRLERYRSLEIDGNGNMAVMTVNGFTKGHMRSFFRRSFRKLKEQNVPNLVIDIRSNGGGRVAQSTLLTRYISRKNFKVADTLYAKTQSLGKYAKYFNGRWLNNIEMIFISKKKEDGKYHIRHLEKRVYKPKKKNHYNGNVYVLTNGPTFSAATLFANAIKGQQGITLLGEETGGGWHGNNGIMIPGVTLPNTGTRMRVPLFRLVQYNHVPKTGTGIIPDIYVGTDYDALMKGYDKKMQVVRAMIKERAGK